jgi:hypothetical protein
MESSDSAIDDTLGQDIVHLNSFSEEQLLEVSEITLQFLVDSKVMIFHSHSDQFNNNAQGSELQTKLGEFSEKFRFVPSCF